MTSQAATLPADAMDTDEGPDPVTHLFGHSGPVHSICYSHDDQLLLSGCARLPGLLRVAAAGLAASAAAAPAGARARSGCTGAAIGSWRPPAGC